VCQPAPAAGARHLWGNVLHLRPGTREHFLEQLARDWPAMGLRYARLFAAGAHLPRARAAPILETVARLRAAAGMAERRPTPPAIPVRPQQLALPGAGRVAENENLG
jgi:hypothetical protein